MISNSHATRIHFALSSLLSLLFATALSLQTTEAGAPVVDPVVTTNANAGGGSLRDAITNATAGSTITFGAGLSGQTIPLATELTINKNLTIDGSSLAAPVTISGQNATRVFNISAGGHTVVLDSLIIANGQAPLDEPGGGILNLGTLTVRNSTISGNHAGAPSGPGGGTPGGGGGIYSFDGTLTIQNSTITDNHAGDGNGGGPGGDGGGILHAALAAPGSLTVQNSTITGNFAGLNILAGSGGNGGGIYYSESGSLTIQNSTLTGNHAGDGGDTSFNGNGGGIYIDAIPVSVTLSQVIIAENQAGSGGIAGGTGADIFAGPITILHPGLNLIGDNDTVDTVTLFPSPATPGQPNANGDLVGTSANLFDPKLGLLANNGGPTQTRLPISGSPVVDFGDPGSLPMDNGDLDNDMITAEPLPVDQRGPGFARVVGAKVDLGAVEVQPPPPATVTPPADNSALLTKIKKLKKKIKQAKRKKQIPKAKRLTKKLKKLLRQLRTL